MDVTDTHADKRYSYHGEGVWRVRWQFLGPSCEMIETSTGETMMFGQNCTTQRAFQEIEL
jgi:hypothetical protein